MNGGDSCLMFPMSDEHSIGGMELNGRLFSNPLMLIANGRKRRRERGRERERERETRLMRNVQH